MTPDDLEARLAGRPGRPGRAAVAVAIGELRADPNWSVSGLTLEHRTIIVELLHHPSGTACTLRRRHSYCSTGRRASARCRR